MTARAYADTNADTPFEMEASVDADPSEPTRFERPSAEEISLCCEISAYAPDGDDRPLF